ESPTAPPAAPQTPAPPAPRNPSAPLRRDDYISAAGTVNRRPAQYNMVPRGSVSVEGGGGAGGGGGIRPKDRPKNTPMVAAIPRIELPQKKAPKEEAPAQKPVVKLTKEMIDQT